MDNCFVESFEKPPGGGQHKIVLDGRYVFLKIPINNVQYLIPAEKNVKHFARTARTPPYAEKVSMQK